MRIRLLGVFIVLLTVASSWAQQSKNDWENPEVFAVNRETAKATFWPFPCEKLAEENKKENSPYFLSLNGTWKFHWVSKPADRPINFYEESFDVSRWDDFTVPGNWEINGYGTPIYVSGGFGFPKNPPFIPHYDNPVGSYRRTFDLPANWDGRKVFLHFEAGVAAMYIWVNGQKVGYSQVTKSPCEFDITSYLRKGNNTIALEVYRWSDGSYLEDQDFWRLSGFDRGILLYSTAQTRIADFFAVADLEKNYKDGLLSLDVKLQNYSSQNEDRLVEFTLLDKNGKKIATKKQIVALGANNTAAVTFKEKVGAPALWSAEYPNLYTLLISMKDKEGKLVEATSCRVGFRKVEIKEGVLMVNGKRIMVRGTNLHEHHPLTGHVMDRETIIKDIRLMKEFNLNAIRTSHYPQPTMFYELCDEYGMYVVDEANSESHGMGYGKANPAFHVEWLQAHLDRAYSLVERDKNHPSVIIWSLGNEASNGDAYFATYKWIKERDLTRPVQYEQAAQKENTDIVCPMYPSINYMKEYASKSQTRPFIMCEYSHAMGNSNGNFLDYFDIIHTSKHMQGGFIWDWVDQGLLTKDDQGRSYYAYGGDLGGYNRDHSENFCANGLVGSDRVPHPGLYEVKMGYQPIRFEAKDLSKGLIVVKNEYNFTDLNIFDFNWKLLENGQVVEEGVVNANIAPETEKEVKISMKQFAPVAGKEYYLALYATLKSSTALLKAGHELARAQFAIEGNDYFSGVKTAKGEVKLTQQGAETTSGTVLFVPQNDNGSRRQNVVVAEAGDAKVTINLSSGKIDSYIYKGKTLLRNAPQINFWRAPIDNDYGWNMQRVCAVWREAGNHTKVIKAEAKEGEEGVVVDITMKLTDIGCEYKMKYTVSADGALKIEGSYEKCNPDLPEMPRFGMTMEIGGEYENFAWYGRGPWENYSDRNHSSFIGTYNSTVKEQYVPYIRPQENGNKTDVRWLTLTNNEGDGIRVEGIQPLSVSALHYRAEDMDAGATKKQQHTSDLIPQWGVILNVDLKQSGVGGDNSWGAKAHEQYRLREDRYSYGYIIRPSKP